MKIKSSLNNLLIPEQLSFLVQDILLLLIQKRLYKSSFLSPNFSTFDQSELSINFICSINGQIKNWIFLQAGQL